MGEYDEFSLEDLNKNMQMRSLSNVLATSNRSSTNMYLNYRKKLNDRLAEINNNVSNMLRESCNGIDHICNRVRDCLSELEQSKHTYTTIKNEVEITDLKEVDEVESLEEITENTDDDETKSCVGTTITENSVLESLMDRLVPVTDGEPHKIQTLTPFFTLLNFQKSRTEDNFRRQLLMNRTHLSLLQLEKKIHHRNSMLDRFKENIINNVNIMDQIVDNINEEIQNFSQTSIYTDEEGDIQKIVEPGEGVIDVKVKPRTAPNVSTKKPKLIKQLSQRNSRPKSSQVERKCVPSRHRMDTEMIVDESISSMEFDIKILKKHQSKEFLIPDVYQTRAFTNLHRRLIMQVEANDSLIFFQRLMDKGQIVPKPPALDTKKQANSRGDVVLDLSKTSVFSVKEVPPKNYLQSQSVSTALWSPKKIVSKCSAISLRRDPVSTHKDISKKYADSLWFSQKRFKSKENAFKDGKEKKKPKSAGGTKNRRNPAKQKINKKVAVTDRGKRKSDEEAQKQIKVSKLVATPNTCPLGCTCNLLVHNDQPPSQYSRCRLRWIRARNLQLASSEKHLKCLDILDDLTYKDLLPLHSEYPRRDNECVKPQKNVKETLLYRLLYDKRQSNTWKHLLEPSIKCSDKNCAACKGGERRSVRHRAHNEAEAPRKADAEEPKRTAAEGEGKAKKSAGSEIALTPQEPKKQTYSKTDVLKKLSPYIFDPKGQPPSFRYSVTVMPVHVQYDNIRFDAPVRMKDNSRLEPQSPRKQPLPLMPMKEVNGRAFKRAEWSSVPPTKPMKMVFDGRRQPGLSPHGLQSKPTTMPYNSSISTSARVNEQQQKSAWKIPASKSFTPKGFSQYLQNSDKQNSGTAGNQPNSTGKYSKVQKDLLDSIKKDILEKQNHQIVDRKLWAHKYQKGTGQQLVRFIDNQPPQFVEPIPHYALPQNSATKPTEPQKPALPKKMQIFLPTDPKAQVIAMEEKNQIGQVTANEWKYQPTTKLNTQPKQGNMNDWRRQPNPVNGTVPKNRPANPAVSQDRKTVFAPLRDTARHKQMLEHLHGLKQKNSNIQSNIQKAIDVIEKRMVDILSSPANSSSVEAFDEMEKEITNVLSMMKCTVRLPPGSRSPRALSPVADTANKSPRSVSPRSKSVSPRPASPKAAGARAVSPKLSPPNTDGNKKAPNDSIGGANNAEGAKTLEEDFNKISNDLFMKLQRILDSEKSTADSTSANEELGKSLPKEEVPNMSQTISSQRSGASGRFLSSSLTTSSSVNDNTSKCSPKKKAKVSPPTQDLKKTTESSPAISSTKKKPKTPPFVDDNMSPDTARTVKINPKTYKTNTSTEVTVSGSSSASQKPDQRKKSKSIKKSKRTVRHPATEKTKPLNKENWKAEFSATSGDQKEVNKKGTGDNKTMGEYKTEKDIIGDLQRPVSPDFTLTATEFSQGDVRQWELQQLDTYMCTEEWDEKTNEICNQIICKEPNKDSQKPEEKFNQGDDLSEVSKESRGDMTTISEETTERCITNEISGSKGKGQSLVKEMSVINENRNENALQVQPSKTSFEEQVNKIIKRVEDIYSQLDDIQQLEESAGGIDEQPEEAAAPKPRRFTERMEPSPPVSSDAFLTPFMQAVKQKKEARRPPTPPSDAVQSLPRRLDMSPSYYNVINFLDSLSDMQEDHIIEVQTARLLYCAFIMGEAQEFHQAVVQHTATFIPETPSCLKKPKDDPKLAKSKRVSFLVSTQDESNQACLCHHFKNRAIRISSQQFPPMEKIDEHEFQNESLTIEEVPEEQVDDSERSEGETPKTNQSKVTEGGEGGSEGRQIGGQMRTISEKTEQFQTANQSDSDKMESSSMAEHISKLSTISESETQVDRRFCKYHQQMERKHSCTKRKGLSQYEEAQATTEVTHVGNNTHEDLNDNTHAYTLTEELQQISEKQGVSNSSNTSKQVGKISETGDSLTNELEMDKSTQVFCQIKTKGKSTEGDFTKVLENKNDSNSELFKETSNETTSVQMNAVEFLEESSKKGIEDLIKDCLEDSFEDGIEDGVEVSNEEGIEDGLEDCIEDSFEECKVHSNVHQEQETQIQVFYDHSVTTHTEECKQCDMSHGSYGKKSLLQVKKSLHARLNTKPRKVIIFKEIMQNPNLLTPLKDLDNFIDTDLHKQKQVKKNKSETEETRLESQPEESKKNLVMLKSFYAFVYILMFTALNMDYRCI